MSPMWKQIYAQTREFITCVEHTKSYLVYCGDDADILRQLRKLNTIGNVLIRRFGGCSREVKRELFRAHCSAFYTGALWSIYSTATIRKLKVCHNDILRRLMGIPRWSSARTLFVNERLNNIDVVLRKQSLSLKCRIFNSVNLKLLSLYNSHAFMCSETFSKWLSRVQICYNR